MAVRAVHPAPTSVGGPAQRGRGYTLTEVLLALAMLGMVSGAVSGLLATVARGTSDQTDTRRRNAYSAVVAARLDSAIRGAGMVLAADNKTLVLWLGDRNADGTPQLSEVRRIEWDAQSREICSYAAPADLPSESDVSWKFSVDFLTITAGLRDSAVFPRRTLAARVVGLSIDPLATPQSAKLVSYMLTFQDDQGAYANYAAAALRSQTTVN